MVELLATNPNLCVLTLLAGVFLIYIEFLHPGLVLPSVAGLILVMVSIASLTRGARPAPIVVATAFSGWLTFTIYLLRIAIKARRNKMGE